MFTPSPGTAVPSAVSQQVALATGRNPNDPRVIYDIESSMQLDPVGTLSRAFPVHVLGASISSNVATFKPQRPVIPLRLCIPKFQGTAGAVVNNLTIALQPVFTVSTNEPSANFSETETEISWLPPIVCDLGQTITFNSNSNLVSAGLWVAEISLPAVAAPSSFLARAPFSGVAVTHGTSTTVTVSPQKAMRLRRLAFDVQGNSAAATVSKCTITSLNCGVEPQLLSADPIPLPMFDSQVIFGFMDGDIVRPGQSFTFTINNPDGAVDISSLGGVILGDLV